MNEAEGVYFVFAILMLFLACLCGASGLTHQPDPEAAFFLAGLFTGLFFMFVGFLAEMNL